MFTIDVSDNTINVTRGDILYFGVGAEDKESGDIYIFQPGDIVRMAVYGKKECENVVMQKDFLVETPTESVEIFLDKEETKIGEIINKPVDYWYEIVLNPDEKPQTIVGYGEDGAAVFRLYPEGEDIPAADEEVKPEDIPVIDDELDPKSNRPVRNKAIARAVASLNDGISTAKSDIERLEGKLLSVGNDLETKIAVERARIDKFVALEEGSTTGDAELQDIRVGADGNIYPNAGAAVRGQVKQVADEIDKQHETIIFEGNLVGEIIEGSYIIGDVGSKLKFIENASYGYTKIPVKAGKIYTINFGGTENSWSRITDANDKVLSLLSDARYTTEGYKYLIPSGAKWLYLCFEGFTDESDLVVLNADKDIVTNKVSTVDYPREKVKKTKIPTLFIESVGKTLEEYVKGGVGYSKLVDEPDLLLQLDSLTNWVNASVSYIENEVSVDVTGQNGGVCTQRISSASDSLRIKVEGETEDTDLRFQFLICYTRTDGTISYGGSGIEVAIKDNGAFEFGTSVDCANLSVYDNAEEFFFILRSMNGADTGTFTLSRFDVWIGTEIEKEDVYDKDFGQMIKKINAKISNKDTSEKVESIEVKTVAPNGNKYVLSVQNDGTIASIPTIPRKVLFVGNSLLLGMLNTYGMCASSPENDYYHYVTQAILEKNPSATFTKCHGAAFEMAESTAEWEALWNTTANTYTKKPASESFTTDIDLIVMQMSDNVNTDARQSAFESNIDTFVKGVRAKSPKARIIWVDGWYNDNRTHDIISNVCEKWRIPRINIADLNVKANQGYSGQTYVTNISTGEKAVVKDNWITHPGDVGMLKIAERIIEAIDM